MKQHLINFYLDWVNNYLTPEKMARDYCITVEHCLQLIAIGKVINEES